MLLRRSATLVISSIKFIIVKVKRVKEVWGVALKGFLR